MSGCQLARLSYAGHDSALEPNVISGGRHGSYRHLDMH
jgi:hypothetical protein